MQIRILGDDYSIIRLTCAAHTYTQSATHASLHTHTWQELTAWLQEKAKKSLPTFRHIVKTRCGSARLQPFSAAHCLAGRWSVVGGRWGVGCGLWGVASDLANTFQFAHCLPFSCAAVLCVPYSLMGNLPKSFETPTGAPIVWPGPRNVFIFSWKPY